MKVEPHIVKPEEIKVGDSIAVVNGFVSRTLYFTNSAVPLFTVEWVDIEWDYPFEKIDSKVKGIKFLDVDNNALIIPEHTNVLVYRRISNDVF